MRKSARNIFFIPRAVRFVRSHAMLVVAALVACITMVCRAPLHFHSSGRACCLYKE